MASTAQCRWIETRIPKISILKLFLGSSSGRDGESQTEGASQNGQISGGPQRIFRIKYEKLDSPVVRITASELRKGMAPFLADPGFDVNLLKLLALKPDINVGDNHTRYKCGISHIV